MDIGATSCEGGAFLHVAYGQHKETLNVAFGSTPVV